MAMRWIEQKKQYREYRARIAGLPTPYRDTVEAIERYLTHLGGMDDGDSILEMLGDLADLMERAAADGVPVRDIVGDDPVAFVEEFLSNYPSGKWITKERERLRASIAEIERLA